ncbi:response regulator transcription factor [Flavisphingomonas formosensis]|uniref:response regulator transcription factor n=1 Tax=Flavisphingomonas formosensis TaxID=861534 RepID=UPI001E475FEB|nr:response regulator transcription factor [Sphingomonas formosensis]
MSQNEIEREGLRRVLAEQSFAVVSVHRDHHELDLGAIDDPESVVLVLVDAANEEESLETCRYLRQSWPHYRVVVFAANCQGKAVYDAFQAGVHGYVGKHISVDSLTEMLKLVALGEKIIPSQVFFDLSVPKTVSQPSDAKASIGEANLSDREVQILQRLIRGDANKIISRDMSITEATVKVHVKSILRKLAVANRTQAAIWGVARGLGQTAGHV